MKVTVGNGKGRMKELKQYEPQEDLFTGVEFDDFGNFRISVQGTKSFWTRYQGIAALEKNDRQYIGASAYYAGSFPIECVLEIKPLTTIYPKKPKEERVNDGR